MTIPKMSLKRVTAGVLAGLVLLSGVFVYAFRANGVLQTAGTISSVFFCSCSANFAIGISGMFGSATYMYQPGVTILNAKGQVTVPGRQIISLYAPVGVCLVQSGPACVSGGGIISGTLLYLGTD